jgi:hypothetical protein
MAPSEMIDMVLVDQWLGHVEKSLCEFAAGFL